VLSANLPNFTKSDLLIYWHSYPNDTNGRIVTRYSVPSVPFAQVLMMEHEFGRSNLSMCVFNQPHSHAVTVSCPNLV